MSPSSILSSIPLTVTVCGVFQFAPVNCRGLDVTLPSASLLEVEVMVTVDVGSVLSLMVKVAVPPASVVLPDMEVKVKPASSLSVFVTDTLAGVIALYLLSEVVMVDVIWYLTSPSSILSSLPVMVIIPFGLFQFEEVKV